MKKNILAVLAFAFSTVFVSSFALAGCEDGGDCIEITNPSFDECPDGNCDGGWVNAWGEGNTFAEINIENQQQVWAEGCTELEIGTMAGAPASGEASISNTITQGLDVSNIREDGTGGLQMQDVTTASLDTTATDGEVSGGMVYSDNKFVLNLWNDSWSTGARSGLESQTQMAGMVCETPGTDGKLDSKVQNSSFQNFDSGNGIKTFQSSQTLGTLKIN
jgi:hypothetical protein